jgi:nucleotide-binding universal stress UspA family protein
MTSTTFGAVLVPLDGSSVAEQALSVGAATARRAGASLHLVSVGPSPIATEQYLEWIAGAARAVDGYPVSTALLHGSPAAAISEYIRTQSIDLVVMTTRGHGGVKRWCLGSVAQELLREATCSVLLLHAQELPQPTEFKRILVALDGELDDPVLQPALALGSLHAGCRYFITQVVEPAIPVVTRLATHPTHLGSDFSERREIEVRNYLTGVSDKLREQGLRVTPQLLVGRSIADQVLKLAQALGVDCIAVGTHGLRGAERMLLGSVADKIVRGAEIPVLVTPTQASKRRTASPAVQSAEAAG